MLPLHSLIHLACRKFWECWYRARASIAFNLFCYLANFLIVSGLPTIWVPVYRWTFPAVRRLDLSRLASPSASALAIRSCQTQPPPRQPVPHQPWLPTSLWLSWTWTVRWL
jgi:hypothetical protein